MLSAKFVILIKFLKIKLGFVRDFLKSGLFIKNPDSYRKISEVVD